MGARKNPINVFKPQNIVEQSNKTNVTKIKTNVTKINLIKLIIKYLVIKFIKLPNKNYNENSY